MTVSNDAFSLLRWITQQEDLEIIILVSAQGRAHEFEVSRTALAAAGAGNEVARQTGEALIKLARDILRARSELEGFAPSAHEQSQ